MGLKATTDNTEMKAQRVSLVPRASKVLKAVKAFKAIREFKVVKAEKASKVPRASQERAPYFHVTFPCPFSLL